MSAIDDGGAAFPATCSAEGIPLIVSYPRNVVSGMSLRDWFAGMALQGMMGNGSLVDTFSAHAGMAKESYFLADAMLAARKEGV